MEFEAGRVQFKLQSQFEFQLQLGTRCRSESQRQTEGLGPQDPGWAAQLNEEEVLLWSEELGVNMLQFVPVSNSPLTHKKHQPFCNAFENKVWEVYFSKEVCLFVIIVDYVSACICICIDVWWLYNKWKTNNWNQQFIQMSFTFTASSDSKFFIFEMVIEFITIVIISKFICLNFWDEDWYFYHLEYSDYCLHLHSFTHVSCWTWEPAQNLRLHSLLNPQGEIVLILLTWLSTSVRIGLMNWVIANGTGDRGSIPGRVIPKTQKIVLDAILLNSDHYKVRIKEPSGHPRLQSTILLKYSSLFLPVVGIEPAISSASEWNHLEVAGSIPTTGK